MHSLVKFVSDIIEGISFVLVLFDERVEEIVPLLPESSRPQILQLTFEQLFSTKKGFDLAKELVKAIEHNREQALREEESIKRDITDGQRVLKAQNHILTSNAADGSLSIHMEYFADLDRFLADHAESWGG